VLGAAPAGTWLDLAEGTTGDVPASATEGAEEIGRLHRRHGPEPLASATGTAAQISEDLGLGLVSQVVAVHDSHHPARIDQRNLPDPMGAQEAVDEAGRIGG
jgi:hypothetical protein